MRRRPSSSLMRDSRVSVWAREGSCRIIFQSGSGHFGEIAAALLEAELVELLVFFFGQAEANHAAAGVNWHRSLF